MVLHEGRTYRDGEVALASPDPAQIHATAKAPDVAESCAHWLERASTSDDVYYFSVWHEEVLVGQILLHDIDPATGESLVAYHLFEPSFRRQGIGTRALALLQGFVQEEAVLTHLVIITSRDNLASQRVALKCGFAGAGVPQDPPANGLVFVWDVPRTPADEGDSSGQLPRSTGPIVPPHFAALGR